MAALLSARKAGLQGWLASLSRPTSADLRGPHGIGLFCGLRFAERMRHTRWWRMSVAQGPALDDVFVKAAAFVSIGVCVQFTVRLRRVT
jgi:hypothetical protein